MVQASMSSSARSRAAWTLCGKSRKRRLANTDYVNSVITLLLMLAAEHCLHT